MRKEFTFEQVYSIQAEHLAQWKLVLNDDTYKALESFVITTNDEDIYKTPYDVIRGDALTAFILNYSHELFRCVKTNETGESL